MKWDERIGRRLKLHDLHIFMTVAELGSMGAAAKRLAISQPSISKAVADLEHVLGLRLLDRTPKGVETTLYGKALLQRGLGAFDELRQGVNDLAALADPTMGEVRVGAPEAIAAGLLPAAIDQFSRRYPRVAVNIVAADNMAPEFRPLRERSIDFLLGRVIPVAADSDLESRTLYEDRLYVACSKASPWARRRHVSLKDIADEPWVLSPGASWMGAQTAAAFRAHGMSLPKHVVTSFSVQFCINLLTTGRFVTVLSGSVLHFNSDRLGLKRLAIQFPAAWQVGLVSHKHRFMSNAARNFMLQLESEAEKLSKSRRGQRAVA
jgi:DNA-binding transcriptional LysR family regulator